MSEKEEKVPFYNRQLRLDENRSVSFALIAVVIVGLISFVGAGVIGFVGSAIFSTLATFYAYYKVFNYIQQNTGDDIGTYLTSMLMMGVSGFAAVTLVNYTINEMLTFDPSGGQTLMTQFIGATNLDINDVDTEYTQFPSGARVPDSAPPNVPSPSMMPTAVPYEQPAPAQQQQLSELDRFLDSSYTNLQLAVADGNVDLAIAIADSRLLRVQGDPYATAVKLEIQAQQDLYNAIAAQMPLTKGDWFMDEQEYNLSKTLLQQSGFTFRVEDSGARTGDLGCTEHSMLSIEKTNESKWVHNSPFLPIKRCILRNLADDNVGTTFKITR